MSYFALARQHDVLLCTSKTTRCPTLHWQDKRWPTLHQRHYRCPTLHWQDKRWPTLHQRQHDVLLCIKDNTMSYFALARQHDVLLCIKDNTMSYFALARQHDVLLCIKDNTMSYFALARQHDVLLCIKDNTMSYFASKTTRCPTLHQRKYGVLFSTDRTTQYLALAEQNGKCLTLHSLESASYFAVARATCLVLVSVCLILRWLQQRVSFCTV